MINVVIFDFDGTLVDTLTDVAICFNKALEHFGFPTHPLNTFDRFVGGDLETVVSKMLPENARVSENIDAVKGVYRQLYLKSDKPNTKPYPGIEGLLSKLKEEGFRLAIHSNKGQLLLEDIMRKLFLRNYFDSVVGYVEDRPSKPDAYGVNEICRKCGCTLERAIYVGDGESDLATAANAGIPCVFVTWGQGEHTLARDARVYRVAGNVDELSEILHSHFLRKESQDGK